MDCPTLTTIADDEAFGHVHPLQHDVGEETGAERDSYRSADDIAYN